MRSLDYYVDRILDAVDEAATQHYPNQLRRYDVARIVKEYGDDLRELTQTCISDLDPSDFNSAEEALWAASLEV